jgi:hypothetical protein
MKSNTQNLLIVVGWVLLIIMLLPSIIMSSLGISNLNVFHSNRNNYLYQEYSNVTVEMTANFTNASNSIATLEQILLQIQFGTNNSGSTSMTQEGTIRWQIDQDGSVGGEGFDTWPASVPNSTYRAYTTVLYGITYYVIALDPFLNNPPLKSYSIYRPLPLPNLFVLYLIGRFDKRLFLDADFPSALLEAFPGENRPFVVNTSRCDICYFPFLSEGLTQLRYSAGTFRLDTIIFANPIGQPLVPWPDANFTLRPGTQFLFFK